VFIPDRLNVSVGGVGIGLWFVVGAYFLGLRLVFFDQQFAAKQRDRKRNASVSGQLCASR
jgi:hypothetical protein